MNFLIAPWIVPVTVMSVLRQRTALPVEIDVSNLDTVSSASSDSGNESDSTLPTFTPPQFTIKELLGCIPAHCFERSAAKSFSYVFADLLMIGTIMYAASYIDPAFGKNGAVLNGWTGFAAKWATWNAYWLMCGWNFTGIWIIAHECTCRPIDSAFLDPIRSELIPICSSGGHQAFSTSKALNNAVGLVLHSLVLVPYHSWRISHAKHHAATGHMGREEVFVPSTRSQKVKPSEERKTVEKDGMDMEELLEDAPAYRLYYLLVQQVSNALPALSRRVFCECLWPSGAADRTPRITS